MVLKLELLMPEKDTTDDLLTCVGNSGMHFPRIALVVLSTEEVVLFDPELLGLFETDYFLAT